MSLAAQKSSISWVSGMPPIAEPPTARFHQMMLKPVKPGIGVSAPTITIRPERPSRLQIAVDLVADRDGVEDEVEAGRGGRHLLRRRSR